MERVYLVLRNNQQSGPFTIGELLQQQLKPSDMIWIEGKSAAWIYLSELDLVPHLPDASNDVKPVVNSRDEIERKAEELRQKVLSSAPKYYTPKAVEVESFSSPYNAPDREIEFIDHRKQKNSQRGVVLGELALTVFVIGLFAVGIYKGKSFLAERKVQNGVATQFISGDEHTAQKQVVATPDAAPPAMDTLQKDSSMLMKKVNIKPFHTRTATDTNVNIIPSSSGLTNEQTTSVNTEKTDQPAIVPPVTLKTEDLAKKDEAKKEVSGDSKTVKTDTGEEDKKKGFLGGLFKKKKKDKSEE